MAQINILDYNKIVYFDENTGNYKIFDGERWWLSDDKFGTSTMPSPSNVALVDSAIVDTSVVGEEEAPAMQTIWEGTFTPTEEEETPFGTVYGYMTEDVQNAELLRNVSEVNVTLDGTPYTLSVVFDDERYIIGELPNTTPFVFAYDIYEEPYYVSVATLTEGSHTIKVEYTPSPEPPMQTIWEGTFDDIEYIKDVPNIALLQDAEEATVTFDDVVYTVTVNKNVFSETTTMYGCGASDSSFVEYPFSFGWVGGDTFVTFGAKTSGEHTIKIEETPSNNEDIPTDDPIEDIDWSALQPGKDN